jgi:hypothetical protein
MRITISAFVIAVVLAIWAAPAPAHDTLGRCRLVADRFGLAVTSTYRTPERNRQVGGAPNSMHTHGSPSHPGACDLAPPTRRAYRYVRWRWDPPELIMESDNLHIGWF